jgi:hypothetical protein
MSLRQLSTERDVNIVEYCDDGDSLLALCSTSRYWQSLAEPHLYEHVWFTIEEACKAKALLRTLLNRPELAQYIRIIDVDPSADTSGPTTGPDASAPVQEHEKTSSNQARREQRIHDDIKAATPQMTQIIETAWPKLSELIKTEWVQRMNDPTTCYDPFLAMILTLATNLEEMNHQYSESGVTLSSIILHYHRTAEEIASGGPRPLGKLEEMSLCGVAYPHDPGQRRVYWVPLPVNVEQLAIRNYSNDHFEYPTEREEYHIPRIEAIFGVHPLAIKELHHGFVPTLRTLDLLGCQIEVKQMVIMLETGYCHNVKKLRLAKNVRS